MSKRILQAFGIIVGLSLSAGVVAEEVRFPAIVKMVVPFAPGASTDVLARALANQLGPRLGSTVVVENKPGASGMIGASGVVKAPGDGATILFASVSMISAAAAMKSPPINIVKDLKPVAVFAEGPLVVAVANGSPYKTFKELVAAAKAKPDTLVHGTAGIGTLAHLTAELMDDMSGAKFRHIPYKGASPAVTDMLGERLDVMFAVKATFGAQVEAGKIRLLAITSKQPSPIFPNLPTVASEIPGYDLNLWTAVFVPPSMPEAMVNKLNKEINEVAKSPKLVELLRLDAAQPIQLTPEQSAQRARQSFDTYYQLAKKKNIVFE